MITNDEHLKQLRKYKANMMRFLESGLNTIPSIATIGCPKCDGDLTMNSNLETKCMNCDWESGLCSGTQLTTIEYIKVVLEDYEEKGI